MTTPTVSIVDTGVANVASLQAAFRRLNVPSELTSDADKVFSAPLLVLPGVGSFAAGMERLRKSGLDARLIERIQQDRPTLAICLGLQLLCSGSEESPGVSGLGILPNLVKRFSDDLRIPQLGWNSVVPQAEGPFPDGTAYFANSYRIQGPVDGFSTATTDYGGEFVSAIWRGSVLACQFHPELSAGWGARLLERWVTDGLTSLRSQGEPPQC